MNVERITRRLRRIAEWHKQPDCAAAAELIDALMQYHQGRGNVHDVLIDIANGISAPGHGDMARLALTQHDAAGFAVDALSDGTTCAHRDFGTTLSPDENILRCAGCGEQVSVIARSN